MMPITSRVRPLTSTVWPIMSLAAEGGLPELVRQDGDTAAAARRRARARARPTTSVSPLRNKRPATGWMPRARQQVIVDRSPMRTRSGRSPAVRLTSPVVYAPTAANDWFSSRNSKYSGGDTQN